MNKDISNCMTLEGEHDPMGRAILDYQQEGKAGLLTVRSSMFDDDVMPVEHLFRSTSDMPALEREALHLARGRVLDVGAGAGCHALALQERGLSVKAIDISPLSCEAMKLRGVKDVECVNLFDPRMQGCGPGCSTMGGYDTIMLLMNGTGIAGTLARLPSLLMRLRLLLRHGGQVLIDSSDLRYIYEDEDGNPDIPPDATYYGEVDYQMIYRSRKGATVRGRSFNWLYTDFPLLQSTAATCGMRCTKVAQGEHYDYLAKLE